MFHHLDYRDTVPTQRELKALKELTEQCLPEDPTPSLDEIARQPDVAHLGSPQAAPQAPHLLQPLRLLITGNDAAVSAVITRLMRMDALWVELAINPTDSSSPLATNWGLGKQSEEWLRSAPAVPTPLIRDDAGVAVAGSAQITDWEDRELYGEVIVDSEQLCIGLKEGKRRKYGIYGASFVPMLDAPGLIAAPIITSATPKKSLFGRTPPAHLRDTEKIMQGRALQAGGSQLRVTVDGIDRKRPVESATFYRHLRDLQVVR